MHQQLIMNIIDLFTPQSMRVLPNNRMHRKLFHLHPLQGSLPTDKKSMSCLQTSYKFHTAIKVNEHIFP